MFFIFRFTNKVLSQKFFKYPIPILWILVILYLCFFDLSEVEPDSLKIPNLDKLVHLILYYVLCYLLMAAKWSEQKNYNLSVIVFCILLGIFVELMQNFVFTYRSAEYLDMLSNLAGIFLGFFTYLKTKSSTN